jgi:hypothetical protein
MILRVATLDNYYESLEDSRASELLLGLGHLRRFGYGPEYPKSFLPLDSTDFIALHHFLCIEERGKLVPVAGYRSALLSTLDFYQLPLPLLHSAEDSGAHDQVEALQQLILRHRGSGIELINSSYFTVRKDYRADRGLAEMIQEIFSGMAYLDTCVFRKSSMLTAAALRFKTDRYFSKIGFSPMRWQEAELPSFKNRAPGDEPILPMLCEQTTAWAAECYFKHRGMIDSRILIEPRKFDIIQKAA